MAVLGSGARVARRAGIALALPLCAVAPAAHAYTSIGPNFDPNPGTSQHINYPSPSVVFNAGAPPGVRLLSPIDGVITRWTVSTGSVTEGSTLRLRVMRPEGGTNYHMVRSGPLETLTATTDQTRWSFAAHVPILTGEGIGFAKASPPGGFLTVTLPQDEPAPSPWILAYMSPPPDDGFSGAATLQDNPGPGSDLFVVLSADIEPDADGDLFGDDTQDLCPGRAGADRGCPPGALDPPAPVVVVNTITPASALAEIDPASVGINAGRRLVSLRVSCPAQRSVSCRGVVAAKTAKSVRIRAGQRRRAVLSLGRAKFTIPQGRSSTLKLKVPRRTRTAIAKLKRIPLTVTLSASKTLSRP